MEWLGQKIDVLIAAIFVAVAAVAASQGHAFLAQYQDRLAGDLGLARAHLEDVKTGLRYKLMSDVVRKELEDTAQARFDALSAAQSAFQTSGDLTRPWAFFRHRDQALVAETAEDFVPRLPQGSGAHLYVAVGALAGFVFYEILKLPLIFLVREPRRRKFRRRS